MKLYPKIEHIDQIADAIAQAGENAKAFVISEREDYSVAQYRVQFPGMFDHDVPMISALLRECRGITFDKRGYLISRPFHKFYNVNQHPTTQENVLGFNLRRFPKMDGSMLRPVLLNGEVTWMTKAGHSDVSVLAQKFYEETFPENAKSFLKNEILRAIHPSTPLFEFISPANRIVVDYPETKLVLLNVRDNYTGIYTTDSIEMWSYLYGLRDAFNGCFDVVETDMTCYSVEEMKTTVEGLTSAEGFVTIDEHGSFVKWKAPWYLARHGAVDKFRFTRNIIAAMLDESIDDIYPNLTDNVKKIVDETCATYMTWHLQKVDELLQYAHTVINLSGQELYETVKNSKHSAFTGQIIALIRKGHATQWAFFEKVVEDFARKCVQNNTRWGEFLTSEGIDIKIEAYGFMGEE